MGEQQKKTLAEEVVELLKVDELTVTTAESCTGGLVAARLVDVPGVSEVFKQGFITYSNKAKRKLLNVKKTTLKEFGAVSEKTAREMAKGAILASGADAAIATTGIAGTGRRNGREAGGPCIYRRICTGTDVCGRAPLKAIGAKYGRVPCGLLWRF